MRLHPNRNHIENPRSFLSVQQHNDTTVNESIGLAGYSLATEGVIAGDSDNRVFESPHLDRAKPAASKRNHTHVLGHWERDQEWLLASCRL